MIGIFPAGPALSPIGGGGLVAATLGSYLPQTLALVAKLEESITVTAAQKAKLDTFLRATLGIASARHVSLFLFVWQDAAANAIDVFAPDESGTFSGTWEHAYGYAVPSGGHFATGHSPADYTGQFQGVAMQSVTAADQAFMGCIDGVPAARLYRASGELNWEGPLTGDVVTEIPGWPGALAINHFGTDAALWDDGSELANATLASDYSDNTAEIYVGAVNVIGESPAAGAASQYCAAWMGDGMPAEDAGAFITALLALLMTLMPILPSYLLDDDATTRLTDDDGTTLLLVD